jgi:hypothetical protein
VASNSVPVAIGSRRIFAVPLDLARRNLADVDVMPYARIAPEAAVQPGSIFLRSDNSKKATRALHRMTFARLSA